MPQTLRVKCRDVDKKEFQCSWFSLANTLTFTLTPARCVFPRRLVLSPCAHAAHLMPAAGLSLFPGTSVIILR